MFESANNGDNDSNDKEEKNLLTHLPVKGNPVEIHGAGDLHSGKDEFKSLEAKKDYNCSLWLISQILLLLLPGRHGQLYEKDSAHVVQRESLVEK